MQLFFCFVVGGGWGIGRCFCFLFLRIRQFEYIQLVLSFLEFILWLMVLLEIDIFFYVVDQIVLQDLKKKMVGGYGDEYLFDFGYLYF